MTQCNGENTVSTDVRICCDARRENCNFFYVIEKDNYKIPICLQEYMCGPPGEKGVAGVRGMTGRGP